ncbi:hypothetical protein HFP89_10550 [Wenzhouxiangella sp. XN79A]|uniref:FitA-like ribbon-helix-helix domain-containing protein n=1 Tax=Wenzhouxiangella sp. XN79A TaxID=2724193 RepID=UPI00144AE3A2|nr:hypothetical protein [Wenzhouxiangella sp. XN79A]NKI35603.1 hypothetical protein [Wenzhouxiangella sp. XN79A]
MSRSITIHQVPDEICDALEARASRSGQSLQDYLLARLVRLAGATDPQRWMARIPARIVHECTRALAWSLSAQRIFLARKYSMVVRSVGKSPCANDSRRNHRGDS